MTDSAFFMLRLNDHIQYMKKIQKTLDGKGDFRGTAHHDCKLGQWLYGTGPDEVKSIGNNEVDTVFESLFEPHKQYHEASKEVIRYFDEDKKDEMKDPFTKMIVLSNKLVDIMLKLDQIVKKQ